MTKKKLCEKCNKEISNNNYSKHINSCKGIVELKVKEEWLQENGKYKCPYCSKEYKKLGISNHIWRYHTEQGKDFDPNIGYKTKNRKVWNKGLNKEVDERVKKCSDTFSKNYKEGKFKISQIKDKNKWKEKLSLATTRNHNGGYKNVPYINYQLKNGEYIKLRGSYEVRFAKYLDENNIEWKYQNSISYIDQHGVKKHSLPDFYIPSLDKYFDTKGVLTDDFKEKMKLIEIQNSIKIHLIYHDDLCKLEKGNIQLENLIK